MNNINRYALVVQPRKELLDWVNTIFPGDPVSLQPMDDDEATVYLIPEFDSLSAARTWLRKHFKPILEQELEDWCTDPDLWPALSWKTFESFLEYRIQSLVLDVAALNSRNKKTGVPRSAQASTPDTATGMLKIEISLDGSQPQVWRRVLIATNTTFLELHYIIQFSMGWTNSHLHHFIMNQGKTYIGIPFLNELDDYISYVNSTITRVGDYLNAPGDQFTYEYDFGDGWRHTITLINRMPHQPGITLPRLLGGARACPPEDCGGIGGYHDIVEALKKPRSKAAIAYAGWLETGYDPAYFNPEEVQQTYFSNFPGVMAEWEAYAEE